MLPNLTEASPVPGYIKRVEKRNPERQLQESLGRKFGERFREYRNNYFRTLSNPQGNYEYVPDYPITVLVELLNRCNLECIMCHTSHRSGEQVIVRKRTIERIMQEFSDNQLPALMFGAGDEPLLYKEISKVWDMADAAGIMDLFLFTNGTLLTESRSRELVERGFARVFVSLDAATPDTYAKIRRRNKKMKVIGDNRLSEIEDNIHRLVNIRSKLGKVLPQIRVSFAVQESNKHEIEIFKEKWQNVVDFLEFQACSDYDPVDKFAKMSRDSRWERRPVTNEEKLHCTSPFNTLTVWYDGNVSPCCTFNGKNLIVGNIHDNTLREIWHGKEINELREQFRTQKLNEVCQSCLRGRRNDLFSGVIGKRCDE